MARQAQLAELFAGLDPRRSLSIKLALFYGGLFVGAVALILLCAQVGIERYAERVITSEMRTGAQVFDRVAEMRYAQLRDAGDVLAADFGFRSAMATGDEPTISSALDSLQRRLKLSQAFVVTTEGQIIGFNGNIAPRDAESILIALDSGADDGVLRLGGENFNAVAAPIKAPSLIGWVVFANAINAAELKQLEGMSAIGLTPRVVPVAALPAGIVLARGDADPIIRHQPNGERMLVLGTPLNGFGKEDPQALLLEYSLTRALSDYAPIFWMLFAAGLAGILIVAVGSLMLARRLTRPIKVLEAAARDVSAGEYAQVPVVSRDELGALAISFNRMVDDISAREREIAHMAFHDSLTGLANRSLLREQLGMTIARSGGARRALMCLDLDNFKVVNDTLGHPTGDALLCDLANRLSDLCGEGFIARLGGDEFAIIFEEGERSLDRFANDVITEVARPCTANGHRIQPATSIGIALIGQDGTDVTTLLKNADLALYRAKNEGRASYRFFEPAMDAEARARRNMELDLHDALAEGQLSLMFQPLFNLAEGRVSAFEALLRWNHPVRGSVSPVDFIPLAEDTGLILPIGEWVIREACRVAVQWPDHIRVAVNVSPVQFRSPGLNTIILQALAETGLSPNRLELEITESLFIENVESTLAALHSLRAIGVRVALDDFGTGYSSLSYLRSFPFDKIKIDRSFIMDLLSSEGASAIIRSITTLAEALGMETTAEGVEDAGQVDALRAQGCSHIQGYYFSRPINPDGIPELLGIDLEARAAAA